MTKFWMGPLCFALVGAFLSSTQAQPQKAIPPTTIEKAAMSVVGPYVARCNGMNYTWDGRDSLYEFKGPVPRVSAGMVLGPRPNGVSDADVLNGRQWFGRVIFDLGSSARSISTAGFARWQRASGLQLDLELRDGMWLLFEDRAELDLNGSFFKTFRGVNCQSVARIITAAEASARAAPPTPSRCSDLDMRHDVHRLDCERRLLIAAQDELQTAYTSAREKLPKDRGDALGDEHRDWRYKLDKACYAQLAGSGIQQPNSPQVYSEWDMAMLRCKITRTRQRMPAVLEFR